MFFNRSSPLRFKPERQLVLHVIRDCARNGDAAGFRQLLQAGGDYHAFAMAVLVLDDHVAEVDAHANIDALPVGEAIVALGHLPLEQHRAFHGIHHAAEFGQAGRRPSA